MVDKPAEVRARAAEWATLTGFVGAADPHLRLAVVSGRRRVGKSFLLRALARTVGGLYVTAVAEEGAPAARQRFARQVANYAGVGPDLVRAADWESLLRSAIDVVVRRSGPAGLLVIDELPYWMAHSPEIPGLLQLLYDDSRAGEGPAGGRVILCGSALSVMNTLLSGTKALRGRAAVDLRLEPFDLRTTASHWEVADPAAALHLHAVLGGSPGYRDLAPAVPRQLSEFPGWIVDTVLNPGQALYSRSETEYLLREDPKFTGTALHYGILSAVAAGASSPAKIGAVLERDRTALARAIEALISAGYLHRQQDPLWQRRPVITIADPIIRFHNLVTVSHYDQVETGRSAQAWRSTQETFASRILGPHFEECARAWLRGPAPAEVRGDTTIVSSSVVNDSAQRAKHEIDVLGLRQRAGRAVITVLGEAKATVSPRGTADLHRLDLIKALLGALGHDVSGARSALFSMYGFRQDLLAEARRRGDVLLVDLPALLGQAEPPVTPRQPKPH